MIISWNERRLPPKWPVYREGEAHERARLEQISLRAREAGFRGGWIRDAPGLRSTAGDPRRRRELRVLRRPARADPGIDQALAELLRRRGLGGRQGDQAAARGGRLPGTAGDLQHRRTPRRRLGPGIVELEEQPRRRAS